MTLLHRFTSIVRWACDRNRAEADLDRELRGFIEMSAADKVEDGMSPAEARRRALIELGGLEQAKERVRSGRHGGWLDDVGRDVRYAVRAFRRSPGFTLTVVLTLALGIGANTAIFGLLDALLLRWLPVANPQELVQLSLRERGAQEGGESLSYPMVHLLAEQQQLFSGVAGFSGSEFHVGPPGAVTRVRGALVTGGFYQTLGLAPAAGRLLSPSDDRPGGPLVAVASYDYWVRELQQRPDVGGQVLRVNDLPVTIVGVSPRGFVGATVGATADLTMAVSAIAQLEPASAGLLKPGNFWLRVLARPQPSLTTDEVLARLNTIWPQWSGAVIPPNWPASQRQVLADSTFHASSGGTGWTYLREIYRKPLFVLMAVVGVVLLIACANVASLLLARASARRREVAVRLAIGAGRGRIVRQLLIESLMLSLFGAACGVGLAWLSGRALVNVIASGPITIDFDLSPNWHVLLFATLIAVATALLFGVAPALQATSVSSSAVLKDDGRMSGSRGRLLAALVSAQVALSLVLLAGGGLFVRTLQNLHQIDPGFDATDVLLVQLDSAATPVSRELLDDVRRVPGVTLASVATHTPLSGAFWSEPAVPAGQTIPDHDTSLFVATGPDLLASMRIRLLDGREFSELDTKSSAPVAIVNRAYAEKYFGRENVVGERLAAKIRNVRYELEIVGIADNTSLSGLRKDPPRTIYVPYSQFSGTYSTTLVVRGRDAGGRVSTGVQRLLQSRLPMMPIDVDTLASQVDASLVQERMLATLAGTFGLLALVLACVGLYGLLAYSVAQRTKEIGIRMALGAPARRVVRLVLRGAAGLVATGVFVGLPAAWAASRFVKGMLFGVTALDPVTIVGAVAVLALAAQVAAFLPARRASRVDPLVALRHE